MSYDLFTYPQAAGFKRSGTSSDAAHSIDARTPRCSELAALGRVEDSGLRRANSSGKKAVVWQLRALDMAA